MDAPALRPVPKFADPRIWGPFLLASLIWGSTWLVIKDQISVVPPGWTITYRFSIAVVGMLILLLIRRESLRIPWSAWPIVLLVGICQFTLNFQFVYRAELHMTSGIVALFVALALIPNAILARLMLDEPITRRFTIGSLIAIAGLAMLFGYEYRHASNGISVALGSAFAVLAMIAASFASVVQATRRAHAYPFLPMLTWAIIVGTMVDALLAFLLDGPPVWDPRPAYASYSYNP